MTGDRDARATGVAWVAFLGLAAGVESVYILGWHNTLVSEDWGFLWGASRATTWTAIGRFFAFEPDWFVRPHQWLLSAVLVRAVGTAPLVYHAVSQLLDATNAILVGLLARRLIRLLAPDARPAASPLGAATGVLFLASWRHHEAVFWFSAVNEPLAAFFRLATLNLFAWWLEGGLGPARIAAGLAAGTALAILSKESASMLPLELALVLGAAWLAGMRVVGVRTGLWLLAGPLGITVVWAYLFVSTSTVLPSGLARGFVRTLEATPVEWALRLVQFVDAIYRGPEGEATGVPWLAAELGGGLALAAFALIRGRWLWLLTAGWTATALVPYVAVSAGPDVGLVPVLALGVRQDRFLYYPAAATSLGLVATALWAHGEMAHRWPAGSWRRPCQGVAAALGVALALTQISWLASTGPEWKAAGQIVRRVRADVQRAWPTPAAGQTACFVDVPHTHRGRPVYRNGLAESLYLAYGHEDFGVVQLGSGGAADAATRCQVVFRWGGLEAGLRRVR